MLITSDTILMYLRSNNVEAFVSNNLENSEDQSETLFRVTVTDNPQAVIDQINRDEEHPVIMEGIEVFSRFVSQDDLTITVGIKRK